MLKDRTRLVEETLRNLIAGRLHTSDFVLTSGCTFKELGVDSLDVVHIMVALEDTLNIEIEDEEIKSIKDMGAFIAYLEQKLDAKTSG